MTVTSLIAHNTHISYHTTTTSHISHTTHRHLPLQFPDIGHHSNSTSHTHHTHNSRISSNITHISRHTSFTSPTSHITCHFQRPDFNSQRSSLSARIHQITFDLTLVLRLHACRQLISDTGRATNTFAKSSRNQGAEIIELVLPVRRVPEVPP